MFEWRRLGLGFTVVILLIPILSFASPGIFPDFPMPWTDAPDEQVPDSGELVAVGESTMAVTPTSNQLELPESTLPRDEGIIQASADAGDDADQGGENTATTATPTTASTSTTAKAAVTTASTPTAGAPLGGELTGSVCGEVTSDATLVGEVSLCGDLMVMGANTTLFARSGVNLSGNGHQIMFMNGARADWQGTPTSTWSNRGASQNLKRDVNFSNLRRVMFHQGAGPSILKYVAVSDSGTTGVLGDYPLHWHLNGNSTRGTIVEGVVVLNGANHAFVPHGSHGITFKDTIAKNTTGDAYWWDPPGSNNCSGQDHKCTVDNSNDIVWDHALADGVRPRPGSAGHRLTAFTLGAGSGNVVRNSAAINIEGGSDCSGYHWIEDANRNVGGNVWVFRNNYANTDECHGIFVWQNDPNHHVINGFVGDGGAGIEHGAYSNIYEYRNVDVPYLVVHAQDWSIHDSSVGHVLTKEHNASEGQVLFDGVQMTSFTIDNASHNPGNYFINGSNLSCGDIIYESVEPGTRVVIDGEEC